MCTALLRHLTQTVAFFVFIVGHASAASSIDSENNIVVLSFSQDVATSSGILAFQFDGYDVTEVASGSDGRYILDFNVPISPGEHSVQVLLFSDDGEIYTLLDELVWLETEEPVSTSWYANVGLTQRYRLNDKNYPPDVPVKETTGSIRYFGEKSKKGARIEASLDGVYDATSQNNPDLNEWAIAQYKLLTEVSGEDVKGGVSVGHVQAKRESLLFSNFQRRGISLDLGATSDDYQTQVFATQSEETTRYDGDLSVPDDSHERTFGAVASANIWQQHLVVSASYIDAKTDLGVTDPLYRVIYGGDAWGAAIDSFWLSNRLWLHFEHAESNFDSDGLGLGDEDERDEAQQAVVQFNSDSNEGFLAYWNAEMRYQEVGRDFYSIGNFSLPGDLQMVSGRAEAAIESITLSYERSREETNIDDREDLVSQELEVETIILGYTPVVDSDQGIWTWIGAPSMNLKRIQSDNSQPYEESVQFGFDLDQTTVEHALELNFNSINFYWGVAVQDIETDDKARQIVTNNVVVFEAGPDQEHRGYSAYWGWQPSDKTFLNLYGDMSRQREKGLENVFKNRSIGIEGQVELLADKADLQFAYSRSLDKTDYRDFADFNSKYQTDYGSAKLIWHWSEAEQNRPKIDTFLSGIWSQDEEKLISDRNEQWAIFMGIDIAYAGGN